MTVKEIAKKQPNSLIGKAYTFTQQAHKDEEKEWWLILIIHWPRRKYSIRGISTTPPSLRILHDTVEDTGVDLETIKKEFSPEIAFLVDGVTKLGHIKYRGAINKVENLRKMVLALSQDLRVVFIK